MRLAVRGSALPGRNARHCSPPTATTDKNVNNSALIGGTSMRQGRLSSYERENYNRTLEPGILFTDRFSCVASTPFAQIDIQNPESWATEARQILAAKVNRQLPMDSSPGVPTERRCASLAEPAALCCQGSAPASPPPLTAAAFRRRLLLGSGFGKFKAGALSFQREYECLTMQRTAVATDVLTQLFESYPRTVRSGSRVTARSATIGKPSPFPLAFRVALLASSKVRRNFSGRVLHSVVLGLPLGALAAAPGCMKMLRISSARLSGVMLVRFSWSLLGRASRCAERRSGSTLSFYFFPTFIHTGRSIEQRSSNDRSTTRTTTQTTAGGTLANGKEKN